MINIIEFNNEKFEILNVFKYLSNEEINKLKFNLFCDIILKKNDEFYFCNHIKTVMYEDINENNNAIAESIENDTKTN